MKTEVLIKESVRQAEEGEVTAKGVSTKLGEIVTGVTKVTDPKYAGEGEGPEYETAWGFGADCGIDDLNAVTKANYLCNELGMDTITMGATIACAMDLFESGILTARDTGGVALNCHMNTRLERHFQPESMFVQPAAHDADERVLERSLARRDRLHGQPARGHPTDVQEQRQPGQRDSDPTGPGPGGRRCVPRSG